MFNGYSWFQTQESAQNSALDTIQDAVDQIQFGCLQDKCPMCTVHSPIPRLLILLVYGITCIVSTCSDSNIMSIIYALTLHFQYKIPWSYPLPFSGHCTCSLSENISCLPVTYIHFLAETYCSRICHWVFLGFWSWPPAYRGRLIQWFALLGIHEDAKREKLPIRSLPITISNLCTNPPTICFEQYHVYFCCQLTMESSVPVLLKQLISQVTY